MDDQTHNFLALLGRVVDRERALKLIEPVDWREVFRLAGMHNLYGLVFEMAAEEASFRASPEYARCMMTAMSWVAEQAQRTEAFLELYQAFADQGLYPIVMKGIICRQLYGEYADHRPSGDEDLLIRIDEYESVKAVLLAHGYKPEHATVTRQQLEELQEISFCGPTGLMVEVHMNPIGRENHVRRRMNAYFEEVFDRVGQANVNGVTLRTLNPSDHFLFLILHAFKHMMTRGFGIRQVLDILLYQRAYAVDIDWLYIDEALNKTGAAAFYRDLIYIGNTCLGFQNRLAGDINCPNVLLKDLVESGAFGNRTEARQKSVAMTEAAIESGRSQYRFKLWIRTLFPSKAALLAGHPELGKKPWLLPVCWVRRGYGFLCRCMRSGNHLATESMRISTARIELLKKYKIL